MVLVVQASHSLWDERTEYLIKDRLLFMRFPGLGLADPVPDANTLWTLRWTLTLTRARARLDGRPAIEVLFAAHEAALTRAGFLAKVLTNGAGRSSTPRWSPRPGSATARARRLRIKAGRIPESWTAKPAKLAQKDRDARWTVKVSKAKPAADGAKRVDIAVPAFGYKNHLGIDRRHGLIRTWLAAPGWPPTRHDGAQRPALESKTNTASDVWADTAYRTKANEQRLADNGLRSPIHRRKPQDRLLPVKIARGNGRRSKVRAAVEHVFARQKGPVALVVRTIGLMRATVKIALADLLHNMHRAVWPTRARTQAA